MNTIFPEKIDINFLKTLQDTLTIYNLDDLFEVILSRLIKTRHVRQAEIYLFNKQNKLMSVANAKNLGPKGEANHKIRTQSWIIDSSVRHSTRRVRVPNIFFTHTIPLISDGKPLGFLNVQLDHIPTTGNDLMGRFYLIGLQLASKIKQLMLYDEIEDLKNEIKYLMTDNRENQLRITSLSKELYAITAISTKINQSMDLKKSLHKSMLKIKEVFRSSGVLVCLKNPRGTKHKLSSIHIEDERLDARLLKKIEKLVLQNFIAPQQSKEGSPYLKSHHPKQIDLQHGKFNSLIGTPMKSQKKTIGALGILHATIRPFNQDDYRLLSGIANIMGMAIENMNLYRQSQQKKKEAAFLVNSMSTFNKKLDLEKTLTSIVEKGAEFIGPHCRVFLFSETKIPMIQYAKNKKERHRLVQIKTAEWIQPKAVKAFYRHMILQKRPSLVNDIGRSKKIKADVKSYFMSNKIQSILAVPLKLSHKPLGLLVLGRETGGRTFDTHDLAVAEALGAAASVAIENARVYSASVEMSEFFERKIGEKTSEIEKFQEIQKLRVENRKDIIFRVNKKGQFVFVNKAMEHLTGCSREELYRGDIMSKDVVAVEDRKRVRDGFRQMLNGERPLIRDLEYRHLNRLGEDHIISLTVYPEKDQLGRITGIEGVGRDITEKKRLESEIVKTKDLALLGEFSSAIAHQIRNPLGNILMGTKLVQKALGLNGRPSEEPKQKAWQRYGDTEDQEGLAEIFNNLFDGIYNLNQVVTELVEYTKTLKLSRSCQRIEIILGETLAMLKDLIARNNIQLKKNFDLDLPPLSVDAVLIGQVFQNMVHNAIQAMPSGGDLTIATGVYAQKPEYAMISICDTGIGIEPCDVEKIFHPFYTTKDSGTGLGLSLALRMIEAHDGKAWVCRNPCGHIIGGDCGNTPGIPPDRGATFHILLPITDRSKQNGYQQEN
ncbi:MAG: GAF domain-containing protein [Desulfobacterales bacterium]